MSLQVAAAVSMVRAAGVLTAITYDSPLGYDAGVYDATGVTPTAATAAGATAAAAAAVGTVAGAAVAAAAARSTVPWTYDTNSGYDPPEGYDVTAGAVPVTADMTGEAAQSATMKEAA